MTWYFPVVVLMPRSSREDAQSGRLCEAVGHGATVSCTWGSTFFCPKVAICVRKTDTWYERHSTPCTLYALFRFRKQPHGVASASLVSAVSVVNRLTATGDDVVGQHHSDDVGDDECHEVSEYAASANPA